MQKTFILMLALAIGLGLSACSGSKASQATSLPAQVNPQSAVPTDSPALQNPPQGATGNSTVDDQLAAGTLRLEGTVLAVNAEQAKELLPLWQQVSSLSTDGSNTTQEEIQAVYQKIQDVMTSDQMQAIQGMNWSQTDVQNLISDLNIQATPGAGPNGAGFPTQSEEERATRMAQMPTQGAGGTGGPGGAGFQGTPGPNGMGPGGTGTAPDFQGTPGAGPLGGRGMGNGNLFVQPLITLLQERAGS